MKERLLLVEDDRINLKLLTHMLKPYNYQLLTAMSGKEALEMVEQHDPDLILLDIRLPDINGYEICERLKSDQKTKDIPIIVTTAFAHQEYREKAFALGADEFITKPYLLDSVVERIEKQLTIAKAGPGPDRKIKEPAFSEETQ